MAKQQEKADIKTLSADLTDEQASTLLKQWSKQSDDFVKKIVTDGSVNYKYFIGDYPRDRFKLPLGKATVTNNKIFQSIKSVVPFVTSKPAQPVCYHNSDETNEQKTEESKQIAEMTQAILKKVYEDCDIQYLNEQNTINRYIYKIGVLRYGVQDGKIFTRMVSPKNLYFDCDAIRFEDSLHIGEKVEKTKAELLGLFPSKSKEIESYFAGHTSSRAQCTEWWTEESVAFTLGSDMKVLNIKENPFRAGDTEGRENLKYYDRAPLPYVALNVFNTGSTVLDDTSEIDLSRKLQDGINDLLRILMDNARYAGSPIKVAKGMSQAQLEAVGQVEPGDSICIGENQEITYLQAQSVPPFVENLMQRYENAIDAIFGTQATFRGEFEGVQSGLSRDILRQQAANSLAQLSRGIERMMAHLYRGWLHILLHYSDDPAFVESQIRPILGDRTEEYINLLFDSEDGIEVKVLPGSILPDDPTTLSEQAIELAQLGKISTELLYERIGIPNPDQEAEKFALEQTVNAIKSQQLEMNAKQEMDKQAAATGEVDKISAEIDSIGAGDGTEQAANALPGWTPPENPGQPPDVAALVAAQPKA